MTSIPAGDEEFGVSLEGGGSISIPSGFEEEEKRGSSGPGVWSKGVMESWEGVLIEKYPTAHALTKTTFDLVPYMRFLLPSGREEFMKKTTGEQTLSLLLDASIFFTPAVIGKGIRASRVLLSLPKRKAVGALAIDSLRLRSEQGAFGRLLGEVEARLKFFLQSLSESSLLPKGSSRGRS